MPIFRTKRPKKLATAGVDFDPAKFRRLILTKGMAMTWELAARCPCERIMDQGGFTTGTGEFQTDCPECYGRGVVYHSSQPIVALFEDARNSPDRFRAYGETIDGMASMTFLPEHVPSFLDRLTLSDSTMVYSEGRIRRGLVERLSWPIVSKSIEVGTELDATETEIIVVGVIYARKADTLGNLDPTELVEGVDFEVTATGEIDWTLGDAAGTAPATGTQYTISYYGNPTYIVRDFPYSARDTFIRRKKATDTFTSLPTKATLWLEYLGRPEWPQGS